LAETHLALHESVEEDEKDLTQVAGSGSEAVPGALRQRLDFGLARVLAADGKLEKAVGLVEDDLQQHPDALSAYEGVLADCYAEAGQYDRAETEAWRSLNKERTDPDALARYGEILLARHRDRELLQRVPVVQNSRRLHVLRAQAALRLGNLPLARTEIEATRKDNKVPALAAVVSAQIEAKSGNAAGAKQTLDQIGALAHPPAEAFLALALLAQDAGDSPGAIANAREATQVDPRSFEAHCLLGRLLAKAGQTDTAVAELRAAIRQNQQCLEAQVALGNLDLEIGSAQDAKAILETAVGEDPQDEAAALAYARALQALNQTNDAVRAAARATKIAPQDPRGHHLLGKLALAAGDRKLAVKELKEAKRLDKKDETIGEDLVLAEKKK
jgi:tetratricopeptide (TPR) repeat protein